MKYLILISLFLVTACSSKRSEKTYVCVNPAMSLQGFQFESNDPNVNISGSFVKFTTEAGSRVSVPLSLCMTIEKAD